MNSGGCLKGISPRPGGDKHGIEFEAGGTERRTSEWSERPKDSLVYYAFRFARMLPPDTFDFGFVIAVVFGGQQFDLAIIGLRRNQYYIVVRGLRWTNVYKEMLTGLAVAQISNP